MLENQMGSDKMIEISEADFPELPEIAALEREIFPDAWSLKSLEETWKQKNAAIFVAKTKEGMAGYLIFYYVLEEGEIARIATAHSVRRQGAASQMFRKLLDFCREQKITRIMLEVEKTMKLPDNSMENVDLRKMGSAGITMRIPKKMLF